MPNLTWNAPKDQASVRGFAHALSWFCILNMCTQELSFQKPNGRACGVTVYKHISTYTVERERERTQDGKV